MKLAAHLSMFLGMSFLIHLPAVEAQEPELQARRERVREAAANTVQPLSRTARPSPLAVAESEMENQFSAAHAVRAALMVTFSNDSGERIASGTLLSSDGLIVGKASLFPAGQGNFEGVINAKAIRCSVIGRIEASDLIFLKADALVSVGQFEEVDGEPGKFVTCSNEIGVISVGQRAVPVKKYDPKVARLDRFHQRMNVRLSERHSGFPVVLEMDLPIVPEDCGAPVIGLHGEVIGIAIARAGLHASYITPIKEVRRLIPQ